MNHKRSIFDIHVHLLGNEAMDAEFFGCFGCTQPKPWPKGTRGWATRKETAIQRSPDWYWGGDSEITTHRTATDNHQPER